MDDLESYKVISIIENGSFGTCYKVQQKSSQKYYVWKAINYDDISEEKKELLLSEIDHLSKLKHPNIVQYHNHIFHKNSSTMYIIMEYCDGGNLSIVKEHCIETSQNLDEIFIWRSLYQIASALNIYQLHSNLTDVHWEIRPENVFLNSDNNIKLGDFTLVNILDNDNATKNQKTQIWALGCLIHEMTSLQNGAENHPNKISTIYSDELQNLINFLLSTDNKHKSRLDIILRHPTVLSNSCKVIDCIYSNNVTPKNSLDSNLEVKFSENLQQRLEKVRERELTLKMQEEKLNEKERCLIKREKKIILLERMANEKVVRANLYLKRSKESRLQTSKKPQNVNIRMSLEDDLDTSYSADPGDNSILPTSTKIDEDHIIKPKRFVRSKSERRVHFNAQKVFESNNAETDNVVVLKEYNFFPPEESSESDVVNTKKSSKKKNYFGMSVLKSLNSRISQSNSSLGSKSSSTTNSSEIVKTARPVSWTEENKRCAFSLLKIMNTENNKENMHSKITHTKM